MPTNANFGRWSVAGARMDERLGLSAVIIENIMDDRRGKGRSGAAPGSAATVRLQCLGRIRRCKRGGASITRPEVPLDRLPEDSERRAASPFSSLAQHFRLELMEATDGQHRNPDL
jgi:hypothetical protein